MRYDESSLVWMIVVQIRDDLHGHVSFTSSWGSDDQSQTGLHTRTDGFDLSWRELYVVSVENEKFSRS